MNERRQKNLEFILNYLVPNLKEKYIQGAKDHNNEDGSLEDLSDEQLLEEAINEAIDQCVYLITLWQKYKSRL